jgi:hypothetical protein
MGKASASAFLLGTLYFLQTIVSLPIIGMSAYLVWVLKHNPYSNLFFPFTQFGVIFGASCHPFVAFVFCLGLGAAGSDGCLVFTTVMLLIAGFVLWILALMNIDSILPQIQDLIVSDYSYYSGTDGAGCMSAF